MLGIGLARPWWAVDSHAGAAEYLCVRLSYFPRTYGMARFHSLPVHDVVRETNDSISIGFAIPAELRADFAFKAGQYLTLKLIVAGEELRRSYSICTSPLDEGVLRIAVKQVQDGRVSTHLVRNLKAGDVLEVMTPMGSFTTAMDAGQQRHMVCFAGGSGITPVISLVETLLRSEPKSRATLFYGNSDPAQVIFDARWKELEARYADRLKVYRIFDGPKEKSGFMGLFKARKKEEGDALFTGLITVDKASALLEQLVSGSEEQRFFICGPEAMMVNVATALERKGVSRDQVHLELFTSPVSDAPPAPNAKPKAGDAVAQVSITLDGITKEMAVPYKGKHLLDAAADAGLDVPYSCRGGVCSTCRAKVLEGQVDMDMNYALTDGEVAQGYVLTCQAHPRSPKVVLDYDQP